MWLGKDTEGSDCSLLQTFCCSEFAWDVGRNLQKFRNELSKLSDRESKTGRAKILIIVNGYYAAILRTVLRSVSREWAVHCCFTRQLITNSQVFKLLALHMCQRSCLYSRRFHFLFCWCLNFFGFLNHHC
jgi:hypothetical protein